MSGQVSVHLRSCLYGLLRIALRCPEPEGLRVQLTLMTDEDWRNLLTLSREQAVSGLVYEALSQLEGIVKVPEDVSLDLLMDASRIEHRSRHLQTLTESLIGALREKGLHPVIMKGPSAADMYPVPALRVSGDIDLFLPPAEVPTARAFLARSYGKASSAADGSLHFMAHGCDIDLHSRYYDLSANEKDLPEVPSPEATILMLSAHILKHAMGPGVGLRQICDMAMASRSLRGKFDHDFLRKYFRVSGTIAWNRMLASMIHARLGLDTGFFPGKKDRYFLPLERIVFAGGNFGHHDKGRKKALFRSAKLRKVDTAFRFLLRIPFSLRYAPKEYTRYLISLLKGNLSL